MKRREFLKKAGVGLAGIVALPLVVSTPKAKVIDWEEEGRKVGQRAGEEMYRGIAGHAKDPQRIMNYSMADHFRDEEFWAKRS